MRALSSTKHTYGIVRNASLVFFLLSLLQLKSGHYLSWKSGVLDDVLTSCLTHFGAIWRLIKLDRL